LHLEWQSSPKCSSAEQLQADVARILQQAEGPQRAVEASVSVTRKQHETWEIRLITRVEGHARTRSFEAESCAAAESALAVILALSINANVSAEPAASLAEPAAHPPRSAERADSPVTEAATPPPTPSPPSPPPVSASFAAGLALDSGTLPSAAEGVSLGLGLRRGGLALTVTGADWLERTARTSAGGADFHLLSACFRVGYGWRVGQLEVGPVLAFELANLHLRGFGGDTDNFEGNQRFSGLAAGGEVSVPVSGVVRLGASLEGIAWLTRPSFVALEPAPAAAVSVFRPAPVSARAELAARVAFF
jgi:hypothetical protein